MSEESDREHEDRKTETEWMEGERELERAVKNRIAAGNKMAVVALRKLVKWVPECGFPKNVTPFYCDEKLRNSIDEYREEQGLNDDRTRYFKGSGKSPRVSRVCACREGTQAGDRQALALLSANGRLMVYVDDYRAPFGRMKMSHMMADTDDELEDMARALRLKRRWKQSPHRHPHYDVCDSKRRQAIRLGARAVSCRELVGMFPGEKL